MSNTYIEWHIETREHWEGHICEWHGVSGDSFIFRVMQRPAGLPSRSPYGHWGIWYDTFEEAVAAIDRFQKSCQDEDPWDRDPYHMGDHYTEAQYEFRVRKYTYIVDEAIQIVDEPHPALLKKEPGYPHWTTRDYGPIRRRVK